MSEANIKSLSTALKVLNEFVSAQEPLGVVEVAARVGLLKSQTSKILKTFRDFGLVDQDPKTQKYTVGLNLFALGNNYINGLPLSRYALPVMRKLVDATGHSAVLSVLQGTGVIHLLAVEGRLFIDGRWRVGRWMPYHATSAGKVLLAFGPAEKAEDLLRTHGLPKVATNTITDPGKFYSVLKEVKRAGVAISCSETYPGSAAIAVPVFGGGGQPAAALGLICPEHLLTSEEQMRLTPSLHTAARELSINIGAEVYPFGS